MWGWLAGLVGNAALNSGGDVSALGGGTGAGNGSNVPSSGVAGQADANRIAGLNFVNSIQNTQNPFGTGINTGLGQNPGMVTPSWRR